MNNLVKINNKDLGIKEFNNERVVTLKDIDLVHERVEGTAGRNFRENKEHFIEGIDYYDVTTDKYKSDEIRRAGFDNPRGGFLFTESGYLMLVKSLTDDLAWKVQRDLINGYFRGREIVNNLDNLSPQLQFLISIELKQKEQDIAIESNKKEIEDMREVISLDTTSWRKDTASLINKMAMVLGGNENIKTLREESYKLLDSRMGVSLNTRLTNKRRRMADEGVCKSSRDKLNNLDVIAEDKKLIEGYVAIVKEMSIKYGIA